MLGITIALATFVLAGAPALAVDYPVGGTQLMLNRPLLSQGALSLVLKDPSIPVPAIDGADDPSLTGVTLTLFGRYSGQRPTFDARPGRDIWKLRQTPKATTFSFRDKNAAPGSSDLLSAELRTGAGLKLRARGPQLTLNPPEGSIAVRVEYGSVRVCAVFDGPAVRQNKPGRFVARNADAAGLTDCDDATLSGITCDCWSTAQIDAAFPAGFFDAEGRGGAVCAPPETLGGLIAADSCQFGPPAPNGYVFPRGGAMVLESSCVLHTDEDLDDDGQCSSVFPTVTAVTPGQAALCLELLQASAAYQAECP
jgi:hypothetical protein